MVKKKIKKIEEELHHATCSMLEKLRTVKDHAMSYGTKYDRCSKEAYLDLAFNSNFLVQIHVKYKNALISAFHRK